MPRKLAIVAGLFVACVLAAWLLLPKLHRFAYWIDRKTPAQVQALAGNGFEAVRIEPEPGTFLWGLVRRPAAGKGWVLFLPGNSSDLLAGFRSLLEAAVPDGEGIAFWAWRGFEASDGTPSPTALQQDAQAMARHLTGVEGARPGDVEIWSYSLGTAMAIELAANWCIAGTPPRRLVLLSPYASLGVMQTGFFGRIQSDDRYDALARAVDVTCATLILHGSADEALPVAGARELARSLGGNVRMFEMPGCGHADWLPQVRSWLARAAAESLPVKARAR
jgi:pimeloyl-ACP methyl ester carboxylesterase